MLIPLGVLGLTGRSALLDFETRAVESASDALEEVQRERLQRLAEREALGIDGFLGAFEADVTNLRDGWEEQPDISGPYPAAVLHPASGLPGIPGYGYVHPEYDAFADFDQRGPFCPWIPRRVVRALRSDPTLARPLADDLRRAMTLTPLFRRAAARHEGALDLVWVVMASGVTNVYPPYDYDAVVAEDPAVLDLDESLEDYVRLLDPEHNPSRSVRWLEPYLDHFRGVWMTSCVAPLYLGDRFVGTLGMDVLLPTITDAVRAVQPGPNGYAFLVAGSGKLVAGPRSAVHALVAEPSYKAALLETFKPTAEQEWTDERVAAMQDTTLDQSADVRVGTLVAAMREGRSDASEVELGGTVSVVTWAPVQRAGWTLALVLPMSDVLASADATRETIQAGGAEVKAGYGGSVFGVLIAGLAVGVALQRRVAHPLQRLADAVSSVSWGSLNLPPSRGSTGEVAVLEGKFVEILALLRAKREEVHRHEAELRAANDLLRDANESLAREIGERVAAQAALYNEKELLDVTLRSIGDGILVTDATGNVTLLNKVAERLTGWSEAEAKGHPAGEVLVLEAEATGEKVVPPVMQVIEEGAVVALAKQIRLRARNGGTCAISDSGAPIRGQAGKTLGVVLTFRDVTEQRRVEGELQRIGKLETVQVLAAGIAHDFNNLLAAVLGHLSLVRARLGDTPDGQQLGQAERAVGRAQSLTRQLLTFAAGGAPVRGHSDVGRLVADAAGFALQGASTALDLQIDPDLWHASIDEGQLAQAVQNLVINADQAMSRGGVLHVRARNVTLVGETPGQLPPGRYVEVEFEDQGIGIPAASLDRIFDPFFTTKGGGTGLGLAVTHSVIRKHDGHLEVQSEPGKGTTFRFWLPASSGAPAQAPPMASRRPARQGRLLVMDDDADLREVIGLMAAALGFEATEAADGAEAVERVREALASGRPYAVAILDLTVPGGMGGVEAAAGIRELAPDLPLVVSSGYSATGAAARPLDYGFSAAISKPYTVSTLRQTLDSVLDRHAR